MDKMYAHSFFGWIIYRVQIYQNIRKINFINWVEVAKEKTHGRTWGEAFAQHHIIIKNLLHTLGNLYLVSMGYGLLS